MKYILDFDEVLFDTASLKEKMTELKIPESERDIDVFERIKNSDPEFEFKQLVFPGALKFLQEYGNDCIVVSSASSIVSENNTNLEAQKIFQERKILLSGVTGLVQDVRVVDVSKSEVLAELKQEFEDVVFLDDREVYIKEANELGIKSVWMDRENRGCSNTPEGMPTMVRFPRVGSFAEFVKYIELCKKDKE